MRGKIALVVGFCCGSSTLVAQAPGIPVVNAGVARGFTLGGALGFPNLAGEGGGTPVSVFGALGFRRVAVIGFGARVTGSPFGRYYAGGGNVVVKVAGGPLVPISINLQGGVGYSRRRLAGYSGPHEFIRVPLGLGISWTIPQPAVALKPWIAPRLEYNRLKTTTVVGVPGSQPETSTSTDFGLSGGINFGILNGMGLDLSVDRLFTDIGRKPTTFAVGISYTIK